MLEVADIDAGALGPFLRPGLVDVDAEHLFCGMEEDMGGRMVAHQREAPFLVDHALDPLAALQDAAADMVEDDLADLDDVVDACHALRPDKTPGICRLAAALRVKERLVEHCIIR